MAPSDPSPAAGNPNRNRRAVLWCLASAVLFGASTPASKLLLDAHIGPLTLAGLLYLGAAAATAPAALRERWSLRSAGRRNLGRLAGAILCGGILGPVALLVALQSTPSATVSLLLNLETTATALLAWTLFREHMDARTWLANALVLAAGVLLVAPDGFGLAGSAGLVALACVCWGLDNNLTATIDGFTPSQTTFSKGLVAGTVNLSLGIAFEAGLPGVGQVLPALGVGALAYGLSIVLYIAGAQQLGATRSQMLFATAPFLGTALGWVALGEPVLPIQLGSAAVMALALGLLLRSRHEHHHVHEEARHTHPHRHDDDHHDHDHPDAPSVGWHTHEHQHEPRVHAHPHHPDLHHRHEHDAEDAD